MAKATGKTGIKTTEKVTMPDKPNKYTVRAVCPKCKARTLEAVSKKPIKGMELPVRCRNNKCDINTRLKVTAIYYIPEGETK